MNANPAAIAVAIIDASAWALVGLTTPEEQMRERGAEELSDERGRQVGSPLDPASSLATYLCHLRAKMPRVIAGRRRFGWQLNPLRAAAARLAA